MTNLARYHAENLPELFDKITRNSIGMDDYLNRFFSDTRTENYPPYNIVQVNNVETRLEVALAGFKKKEVKVYTEFGKLIVEGKKEEKEDKDLHLKDLLKDPSKEHGVSLMIQKCRKSNLKMDYLLLR